MEVTEIFESISGEAGRSILQGELVTFLRFYGCPLHCSWCDTKHTLEGADHSPMTADLVLDKLLAFGNDKLIITGGEPAVQKELPNLITKLVPYFNKIVIETSGLIDISYLRKINKSVVSLVVDYKPISADIKIPHNKFNLTNLYSTDTIKFPIMTDEDLSEAIAICVGLNKAYRAMNRIMPLLAFSPVNGYDSYTLITELQQYGVKGLLSIQIHKVLGLV